MQRIAAFVDGRLLSSSSSSAFGDVDPATGRVIAEVEESSKDVVDAAVQAARRARRGPWARLNRLERAALLERVADRIDARSAELLDTEIGDTGKPITLARTLDIPRAAANFRAFAGELRTFREESYETPTDDGRGAHQLVVHEPLGVVGVICPWNLPLLLLTWKVAPALAAGNCVVVKPSEETPRSATLLGEIMKEAGVPDGVYNVVHGFGPGSAGEHIVAHPDVAAVTFTGESKTGSTIMARAAPSLKRLSFELGGKNPALVFADADVDAAVAGTLRSTFWNTGQICLCTERVYVHRSLYARFVDGLVHGARAHVAGDPRRETTTLGPLISAAHREKVRAYFAIATNEATVVAGGGVPVVDDARSGGFYVEPTIWTDVKKNARILQEEIFGPCCTVVPFDDDDEAVAAANDTVYGLCAAVWTRDLARAHRVARAVDAGLVWVNTWYLRDLRTPFGGMKRSGIGREGGRWSFDFYGEPKTICMKL